MRKFKVGDRIEILEPEDMGISDPKREPGDVVEIVRVTISGMTGVCGLGYEYNAGWVEDGLIRFVDTGDNK